MDRQKALNWWTGRISDQELAEWSGMAPRAVGLVLNLPRLRSGVTGGGRGGRFTRRIDPKARNAVAIIQALSESGLTFELASNIVSATPYLLGAVTELVDFSHPFDGVRMLAVEDPEGNWLPTDIVPGPVWGRFVRPCRAIDNPNPSIGEVYFIDADKFRTNTSHGTFVINGPRRDLELVPLTEGPIYGGEPDPLGLLMGSKTESVDRFDDHLLIVDGKWIFHKSPEPSPQQALLEVTAGNLQPLEELTFDLDPISVIEPDRKSVRVIGWGRDEDEQDRARKALKNFTGLLDVNVTFAVRRMKRRALGVEK